MDPGVDLCITQLIREGMVRTTWSWIYPHGSRPLKKQLNPAAENDPKKLCACQPFPP
jgi:hypothetical protein